MKTCSIPECLDRVHGNGLCNLHYKRVAKYGDPFIHKIRMSGEGTLKPDGYWVVKINGRGKLKHVLVVEEVLGKELPDGSVVHHVDGKRSHNENKNLVACQDNSYHLLIESRTRAYWGTGHPDWKKCWICKKYDDLNNLKRSGKASYNHLACVNKYRQERKLIRERIIEKGEVR